MLRKHLAYCMFLLNSGVGKDWAGPFFPPSIGFQPFNLSVSPWFKLHLH